MPGKAHHKSRKPRPKRRDCLRCDRVFLSDGPGHRLCAVCHERLRGDPTPEPLGRLATGWQRDGWRV